MQIKYKIIDESFLKRIFVSILEDETRIPHDANWVKASDIEKQKQKKTKVVINPPVKEVKEQ